MTTAPASDPAVEEPAGGHDPLPPVKGTVRRLFGSILPTSFGLFLIWGAVPNVLLQLQISHLDQANRVANIATVATIGAFAAMVAQPLAGTVSDRTRSRWGRRAPWMVIGIVVGGLALITLGFMTSIVAIAIVWVVVQVSVNFSQGPLSAVLPDRIPRAGRGTYASLAGAGTMLGLLGGQIFGALLRGDILLAYVLLAVIAVGAILLFNVFNPDRSSRELVIPPFSLAAFLKTFWVNPVAHPDFFWAFTGRLLLYTGYFVISGYQLLILADYIGLGQDDAAAAIPLIAVIALVGMAVSMVICGPLSDRIGRRKIFVFVASVLVAVSFVVPLVAPTLPGWYLQTAIAGIGFGIFQSIDQALMSEVLPSAKSFAKDLGVVNIAATLPQTIAPALGGFIVLALGGYASLFPVAIVLSLAGGLAVWPIRSVR